MVKIFKILIFIPILFLSCKNKKLDAENYRLNALLNCSQGNFEKAKESIELSMKCNPDEKDSLNIAGKIYYACGENERALEFYDASLQNEISFSSSDLRNYIFLLKD